MDKTIPKSLVCRKGCTYAAQSVVKRPALPRFHVDFEDTAYTILPQLCNIVKSLLHLYSNLLKLVSDVLPEECHFAIWMLAAKQFYTLFPQQCGAMPCLAMSNLNELWIIWRLCNFYLKSAEEELIILIYPNYLSLNYFNMSLVVK